MRRAWLVPVVLAVGLLIQLTVLDGLHLPRGGVPDLVLVLVVAVAIVGGPVPGMATGFAAGLCVDVAPPGSPLIGQYALVFCLAGWAAGSLGRFTKRSPLRALALAAVVIAGAEALAAALGKLLEPDQVSVAEIRQFLPVTIAYDLVLCPFALYLVILAVTTTASRSPASALAGTGQLTVPARSKHATLKRRPHEPRLDPAAARAGDGWVGGPGRHPGSKPRERRGIQFHPGAGVAGSASGYAHPSRLPSRPVKLELSAGRHGDAAIGGGQGRHWQAGRHPGMMPGASLQIRFGGELGGAAARRPGPVRPGAGTPRINFGKWLGGAAAGQPAPARPGAASPRINFGKWLGASSARQQEHAGPGRKPVKIDFRGRLGGSAARQHAPAGPGPRELRINFSAHKGNSVGDGRLSALRPARSAAPRLRLGASRSALAIKSPALIKSVPTVHFHTAPLPTTRRSVAGPKFRRKSSLLRPSARATAPVAGGAVNQTPFRVNGINGGRPRLRLAGRGRGPGMLGGGGMSTVRRPPARVRKRPRFGYGRRSLLTFLTRRGVGGQWLARRRAGRRSAPMLISKRTGRLR